MDQVAYTTIAYDNAKLRKLMPGWQTEMLKWNETYVFKSFEQGWQSPILQTDSWTMWRMMLKAWSKSVDEVVRVSCVLWVMWKRLP